MCRIIERGKEVLQSIQFNYDKIISEIDPKGNIMSVMLERRVLDLASSEDITKKRTRSERAKTLVDSVLKSRHPNCCFAFLEALKLDDDWLSELISKSDVTPGMFKCCNHLVKIVLINA